MLNPTTLINKALQARLKAKADRRDNAGSGRLRRAGTRGYRRAQEKIYGTVRQGAGAAYPMPRSLPAPIAQWLRGNFLAYQIRWILDDSPFSLCLKGRQLGFTDASAAKCLVQALLRRRPQIVLSAAEDNAQELLAAVKRHAQFLAAIGMPRAARFSVDNAGELAWSAGGSVVALAANPRTSRGFHGDVYFDEFAYHADADAMWSAAAPMATRGDWRIRVISTPNGAVGKFHELVTQAREGTLGANWTFHEVDLNAAEADGLAVDRARLLELVAGDQRVFAEAYLCAFLDADLQYFPTALADRARDWKGEAPDLSGATFYAGLDVGRHHDLTVLTVVAELDGIVWVIAQIEAKRTAFKAQRKMVQLARETFRWRKLFVDKTGMGEQLTEELVEEFGEEEVVPVAFTADAKETLATGAFRWLRAGRVRFPRGPQGKRLHAQVIAVRRKVTPSGNVVYESPRTKAGHGDHAWSFFLALRGPSAPELPRALGLAPILPVA